VVLVLLNCYHLYCLVSLYFYSEHVCWELNAQSFKIVMVIFVLLYKMNYNSLSET